jgi:hypothetical protein
MQFRQIGLPVIVASLMGFVFMGPQQAPSQSAAPRPEPAAQPPDPLIASQATVETVPGTLLQRYGGDPKLAELQNQEVESDREVNNLLADYGRTDKEGDRAAIKKKLTASLEKLFDAQQKRREIEVARIEEQLKNLRLLIKKRTESKEKIIDRRLDQLLQDAEGLGWSSPQGFSSYRTEYVPS